MNAKEMCILCTIRDVDLYTLLLYKHCDFRCAVNNEYQHSA